MAGLIGTLEIVLMIFVGIHFLEQVQDTILIHQPDIPDQRHRNTRNIQFIVIQDHRNEAAAERPLAEIKDAVYHTSCIGAHIFLFQGFRYVLRPKTRFTFRCRGQRISPFSPLVAVHPDIRVLFGDLAEPEHEFQEHFAFINQRLFQRRIFRPLPFGHFIGNLQVPLDPPAELPGEFLDLVRFVVYELPGRLIEDVARAAVSLGGRQRQQRMPLRPLITVLRPSGKACQHGTHQKKCKSNLLHSNEF